MFHLIECILEEERRGTMMRGTTTILVIASFFALCMTLYMPFAQHRQDADDLVSSLSAETMDVFHVPAERLTDPKIKAITLIGPAQGRHVECITWYDGSTSTRGSLDQARGADVCEARGVF